MASQRSTMSSRHQPAASEQRIVFARRQRLDAGKTASWCQTGIALSGECSRGSRGSRGSKVGRCTCLGVKKRMIAHVTAAAFERRRRKTGGTRNSVLQSPMREALASAHKHDQRTTHRQLRLTVAAHRVSNVPHQRQTCSVEGKHNVDNQLATLQPVCHWPTFLEARLETLRRQQSGRTPERWQ